MPRFAVTIYEGEKKQIEHRHVEFVSMDDAVAALAGPGLIKVGAAADLRAVAYEENGAEPPIEHAYFIPRFVGADSE